MIVASFVMGFLEQALTGQRGNVNFGLISSFAILPFMLAWAHLDAQSRDFKLSGLFRVGLGFALLPALLIYFFLSRHVGAAMLAMLLALIWYLLVNATGLGGAWRAERILQPPL